MNFISSGLKATSKGFKQAGTAIKRTIKPNSLQKIEKKVLRQDVYQKRIEKGEKYIAKTKAKLEKYTQNSEKFHKEGDWKASEKARKSAEKAQARIAKTEARNNQAAYKKAENETRIESLKEYLSRKLECKENLRTSYIDRQELNKKHIKLSESTIKKTPVSQSRDALKKFFTGSKQKEDKVLQAVRREDKHLEKKLSKLDSKINKLNSGLFQDASENAFDIVEPLKADAGNALKRSVSEPPKGLSQNIRNAAELTRTNSMSEPGRFGRRGDAFKEVKPAPATPPEGLTQLEEAILFEKERTGLRQRVNSTIKQTPNALLSKTESTTPATRLTEGSSSLSKHSEDVAKLAQANAPARGLIDYISTFGTKVRTFFNELFSTEGASESTLKGVSESIQATKLKMD